MTIAEVSEKYGLSADTLRYYERIGLIPPVRRNASGIRDYDEASCNWVNFIKCMRSAGIPIESLIEYVRLFALGRQTVPARMAILLEERKTWPTASPRCRRCSAAWIIRSAATMRSCFRKRKASPSPFPGRSRGKAPEKHKKSRYPALFFWLMGGASPVGEPPGAPERVPRRKNRRRPAPPAAGSHNRSR